MPPQSASPHSCCSTHTAVTIKLVTETEHSIKGLGTYKQGELFSFKCCCRSLVSLFFSGWNKLPPTSKMMADVLKKKPLVERCVILLHLGCNGHHVSGLTQGKGETNAVM